MLTRRGFGAALVAWALPAASSEDPAAYPARAITLVVPWPAGGQTDLTMRVLADAAARQLGQPVVVENRPGAAGTLVGPALRAAPRDGYTIGQLPITVYRLALQQKPGWDPLREIAPVIQLSGVTFGVVVPAGSRFGSLADVVEWARAHPGRLTVSSTGMGSTAHLAMEELLGRAGAKYIHVPYKGTADQMLAVAGATVMVGVNSNGFAPYVDTGKVRLLAIFSAERSARWPRVPTVTELGYPDAIHTSPYGIGVAAGTDAVIVRRLHDAFRAALFDPLHLRELARYDQAPAYLGSADYQRALQLASARERVLLARLGLLATEVR